jgi:hypothetical protein
MSDFTPRYQSTATPARVAQIRMTVFPRVFLPAAQCCRRVRIEAQRDGRLIYPKGGAA